ncbi:tyrosine-type recombinase/integrase [Nocardia gipuzkoensis]|uniref:tyrosine-type recombinase/integrase n=1 Tax=Nocardia gipuzkoensis TaxID=2749991 RepID=UPI003B8A6830
MGGYAGVETGIHQLRHSHATKLINSVVSIEVVCKRLGHASTETSQIYPPARRQGRRHRDPRRPLPHRLLDAARVPRTGSNPQQLDRPISPVGDP